MKDKRPWDIDIMQRGIYVLQLKFEKTLLSFKKIRFRFSAFHANYPFEIQEKLQVQSCRWVGPRDWASVVEFARELSVFEKAPIAKIFPETFVH